MTKALFRYVGPERPAARSPRTPGSPVRRESSQGSQYDEGMNYSAAQSEQSHFVFMTSDQVAEWSGSWSPLSIEEYFQQQNETSEVPGNETQPEAEQATIFVERVKKTMLDTGNSILVDIGSMINAMGSNTEKAFKATSDAAGEETKYVSRQQRLHINGVGSDAAYCDREVIAPITVKYKEHDATKEFFRANIAEGCGANLPAILGSKSMREKDVVIIMRDGHEILTLPGPGGYKIQWSPGTKLLPMVQAPSGHLVIPCDRFSELLKPDNKQQHTFWTDHQNHPHQ